MRPLTLLTLVAALVLGSCELKMPWVKTTEKVKLEGVVKVCDAQGRLDQVLRYEKGLLQGPATAYWPNGRLRWQVNYLRGVKHGIQRLYYPDGVLRSEAPYVRGELEGVVTAYDSKGRLIMEVPVRDGKIRGEVIRYSRDLEGPEAPVLPVPALPDVDPPRVKSTQAIPPLSRLKPTREDQEKNPVGECPSCLAKNNFETDDPVDPEAMVGEQSCPDLPWNDPAIVENGISYVPVYPRRVGGVDGTARVAARSPRLKDIEEIETPVAISRPTSDRRGVYEEVEGMGWNAYPSKTTFDRERPSALAPGLRQEVQDNPRVSSRTRLMSEAYEPEPISSLRAPDDDPDALERERLIRARERRDLRPSPLALRPVVPGPEYIVFPATGARDAEAWRIRLLRQGLNPEDQIRRGL